MKPEDCNFVSEEVFESCKDKGCLGIFEGVPVYITPPPNDKPIKIVYEDSWSLEDNGNEIIVSKRLSEMESKNFLMEWFGTTDVGVLDCSDMSEEEIEEILNAFNNSFTIGRINVVDEDGTSVASTDFTNEAQNLAVWKAMGFQEEDFYK